MTVMEALEEVKNKLMNLHVPISEFSTLSMPLAQSVDLLGMCIEALSQHVDEKHDEDQPAAGAAGEAAPQ